MLGVVHDRSTRIEVVKGEGENVEMSRLSRDECDDKIYERRRRKKEGI